MSCPKDGSTAAEQAGSCCLDPGGEPVAYDTRFLDRKRPLYHDSIADRQIVLLTDDSGATRVYRSEGGTFVEWDRRGRLVDNQGTDWEVTEDVLVGPGKRRLLRMPSHQAFWLGWFAQFPGLRLVTG